jgi:hypothetical protein
LGIGDWGSIGDYRIELSIYLVTPEMTGINQQQIENRIRESADKSPILNPQISSQSAIPGR